MRVNQKLGVRTIGTKPPCLAVVVEGSGSNTPGRIRDIRFWPGSAIDHWLTCEWADAPDGSQRRTLKAYRVASDREEEGSFLLKDEYDRIGRSDLWEHYLNYEATRTTGDHFPVEWLPPRVQELQKLPRKKHKGAGWKPPAKIEAIDDEDDVEIEVPRSL